MTREQLAQYLSRNSQQGPQSVLDTLDERELEVFSIISQGYTASQIESQFGIPAEELTALRQRLKKKLNLKNDIQLIRFAAQQGAQRP
jgi:DNA-binding NarL/FixJ family response regulator